eukprot:snap_masked-scaffold_74-processed-gene-0.50-mRNA-1 protein AED:1.00 eAED:1.00 QI:0/0/0/0/1/1/7/0/575
MKNIHFDIISTSFMRLFSCFPMITELDFYGCTIEARLLNNISKFGNIENIQSIKLIHSCSVFGSEWLTSFWNNLVNIKSLEINLNGFTERQISDILNCAEKWKRISSISYSEGVTMTKHYTASVVFDNMHKLFIPLNYLDKIQKEEVQNTVNKHKNLVFCRVNNSILVSEKFTSNLKTLVKLKLRSKYNDYYRLREPHMFLLVLGDGRTGKTSTLRMISGKKFQRNNISTLLLEDIGILKIKKKFKLFRNDMNIYQAFLDKRFCALTKHQLSVQRVKNVLGVSHTADLETYQENYSLCFEEELLERAIRDKEFKLGFTDLVNSSISPDTFLRVYDFGGQEVFSSVHHIFMTKDALYSVVFNLKKLTKSDIFRLKFWCESVLRNAPTARVIFIGTFFNLFKKKFGEKKLEKVNETIRDVILNLSFTLNVIERSNEYYFYPIDNSTGKDDPLNQQLIRDLCSLNFLQFQRSFAVKVVCILFLDNCKELYSYLTLEAFREKGRKCNISHEDIDEMLQTFSETGIISFFNHLNLFENENYVFLAPSFLAQALGNFIRDPSFHELGYRLNKKYFQIIEDI